MAQILIRDKMLKAYHTGSSDGSGHNLPYDRQNEDADELSVVKTDGKRKVKMHEVTQASLH